MSQFSVSVDGGSSSKYSAIKQFYTPQVLLYHVDNLEAGSHTVKVAYNPVTPGQALAIDYANVFTTPSIDAASGGSIASVHKLPAGAIAGIVLALLFLLVLVIGTFLYVRRRNERRNLFPREMEGGIQRVTAASAFDARGVLSTPGYSRSSAMYSATSPVMSYPETSDAPGQIHLYYAPSASGDSEYSNGSAANNPGSTIASSSILSRNSTSPRRPPVREEKGNRSVPFPAAAGQSLAQIPEAELRSTRRVVPGRAQDFGGAAPGPTLLPPDYSQATEVYNGNGRM